MALLRGGRTLHGHALGVLMLDTRFPRPRGDVGNATTWPFPVRYKIVNGATRSSASSQEQRSQPGSSADFGRVRRSG
jgi:hypothetical protein